MFEKIKTFFTGVGYVFKYGDLISGVVTAWRNYPGLEGSEKLRSWVKPLLFDASTLALLTKTPIDDTIVITAIKLIDNERCWTAIHALALLARDSGSFRDGVLIPESTVYSSILRRSTLPPRESCRAARY